MISCNVGDEDIQETVPELESRIIDQIDSIGQRYLDDGGVMGMTIAVAKKGKVLYNQGFGFIDPLRSQPVSKDVFFEMGSISKLLGATVIMKLVEEGRLSLESSLHELLPAR